MEKGIGGEFRLSDYRLNGRDTALAIEKGLADAAWYASPVPRDKMRELQERRDGPAIRDSLLWFALLVVSGDPDLETFSYAIDAICRVVRIRRASCATLPFTLEFFPRYPE